MTKGLVRYQQCGCFHFVTFSCYKRLPHLGTAAARNLFERSLEVMRARYEFFVIGYVLMPEHIHMLVNEPKKALLSKAIQALKLSVSVQSCSRKMPMTRLASRPPTMTMAKGRCESEPMPCERRGQEAERGYEHGHHDGPQSSTAPSTAASMMLPFLSSCMPCGGRAAG
jgi:REP element-mobilizing transposase RayT